jgi:hypothetical protein
MQRGKHQQRHLPLIRGPFSMYTVLSDALPKSGLATKPQETLEFGAIVIQKSWLLPVCFNAAHLADPHPR